jgi:four helix bundle protein
MAHKFKELIVWQKAKEFVKEIYLLTKKFPNEEQFCLITQIRRAAISIVSNIAEGAGRSTNSAFIAFINIANGSAYELEAQFSIALDLKYINQVEFDNISNKISEIEKLLYSLKKHLIKLSNI